MVVKVLRLDDDQGVHASVCLHKFVIVALYVFMCNCFFCYDLLCTFLFMYYTLAMIVSTPFLPFFQSISSFHTLI